MPAARLVLATLAFAALYAACVPAAFLVVAAVLGWHALRWAVLAAMLPPLLGLGLAGLVRGLVPTALLVGAVAVRTPGLHWPKLTAAVTVPLVDLLLLQLQPLPRLLERAGLLLMGPGDLFLLDTAAPLAACGLAALAVPQRLVRWLLGPG